VNSTEFLSVADFVVQIVPFLSFVRVQIVPFVVQIVPFLSFVRVQKVPFLFSTYIVEYSRANEESERRDYFLLILWSTRAKKESERRDLN
jgi:hypothetical protein